MISECNTTGALKTAYTDCNMLTQYSLVNAAKEPVFGENEMYFIVQYQSLGHFDTLNRGSLLRLLQHIPALAHLRLEELLWVTFVASPSGEGNEVTLTAWRNSNLRDLIFAQKDCFANWGSELKIKPAPKYLFVLLQLENKLQTKSVLKGSKGKGLPEYNQKKDLIIYYEQNQRSILLQNTQSGVTGGVRLVSQPLV